jgi:flagellar hook-length control protein FliK
VELRGRETVFEGGGREAGPGNAGAFENLLARGLEQDLSAGIVREARFVLRDGNEGTIRLSLKPESLGNVKIRLEMAENKITGHIVVESEEALRAFEREIHSLEQTFKDSGFQGAELEMSLAAGYGGADQQWKREEAGPFLSGRLAASRYEDLERTDAAGLGTPDAYRQGRNFINVLA